MRVRKITRIKSIENISMDDITEIILEDNFKRLNKIQVLDHEGFLPGDHMSFVLSGLGRRKFTTEVVANRNSDQKLTKVIEVIKLNLGLRFLRFYIIVKPVKGGFIEIQQQITFATNGPLSGYLWRNGIKNFLSANNDAIIAKYARKRSAYQSENQIGQLRSQRKLQTEF